MIAKGFVYITGEGEVDIKTVAPSIRAVKVNAIYCITRGHIVPAQFWSDEAIDKTFEQFVGFGHIAPCEIQVHEG